MTRWFAFRCLYAARALEALSARIEATGHRLLVAHARSFRKEV